jgi:predicted  nucleic acid-binding Zn-ribbon protein
MSAQTPYLSEKRKTKELKVLELFDKGYSYRQIAREVHISLRDVTKCIHRISNKRRSPSATSVMDEVVLEYRVSGLRREVRDLQIDRDKLMNEMNDLRAQKYDLQDKVRASQSALDVMKRNLENERFLNEVLKDMTHSRDSELLNN